MTDSFDHSKPIYQQIMDRFFQRMCSGDLKPGDKLPSVRETAVSSGVNPNTVQRTYMEMERKGVVESKRGQGTFVRNEEQIIEELRAEMAREQTEQFITTMKKIGFSADDMLKQVSITLNKQNAEGDKDG